jgi:ribosomal protein S6--L-glutamate ligase
MSNTIGIWMYQNGGGELLQQKLVSKLRERGYYTACGLDLRHAVANRNGIICNGVNMNELDLFYSYNAGQQTPYQMYLYETLDQYIPIINNFAAFALTEDKFRTITLLDYYNIPITEFQLVALEEAERLQETLYQWGGKLVHKPVDGWGGRGLTKVESSEMLDALIEHEMVHSNKPFMYVEQFIDYDGTDYRIDIVDGEFVGCYGRRAPKGEWRTNITNGGSIFLREPNDEVVELARLAARITDLEIAGVDLIYDRTREQYIVLEVNGIPAFATPEQEAMGLNFNERKLNMIVDLIDRKLLEAFTYDQAA